MQRLALIALASISCLMSEADASPLQDTIATDLSFIEQQVSRLCRFAGLRSRCKSLISLRGRRQRNVEDDQSFGRRRRMDNRVFSGPALAPVSGDRVDEVARAAKAWTAPLATESEDRPADPTDIGFIIGTSFGNGYRLTGDPAYKNVLLAAGRLVVDALQFKGRRGSILDFLSISFSGDHRQHDDARAVAAGRQQWRHVPLGPEWRIRTPRR